MTQTVRIRIYLILLLFLATSSFLLEGQGLCQERFKLKENAKGKLCLECHKELQDNVKSLSVHPLLKKGECTGCHESHASSHNKLLIKTPEELCKGCHSDILKDEHVSVHKAVSQGDCVTCHNPHGTSNTFILKKAGNELCLDCHAKTVTKDIEVTFPHEPMKKGKGCLNCHNPHESSKAPFLLKNDLGALCTQCHKTKDAFFVKKHMQYPVTNTSCTSCHNAHGSDNKGMLYDTVHAPVALNNCSDCHAGPESQNPLEVKTSGMALCNRCHKDMVEETLDKNRVHWPLLDKKACLNCHNPHGSKYKGLVKGATDKVCGRCHSDTVELQEWSKNNPKNTHLCEPVKSGNCTECHYPHAADNILRIPYENISSELCGRCHEWQTHSSHPIGEKIRDQRNNTLTMDCLSCHKACGTGNKPVMLHFETTYELCIQCHVDRKR